MQKKKKKSYEIIFESFNWLSATVKAFSDQFVEFLLAIQ